MMDKVPFSVLMSVYIKENPSFLDESLSSVFQQSILTDDLVLVCDGPLTDELEEVIQKYLQKHPKVLHVYRLEKNQGLGQALNYGLAHCQYELVARMDTDDICLPKRFETQLHYFQKNSNIALLSSTIEEFNENPQHKTGSRRVPLKYEDILTFSKRRNPFNHPAVMFKKSIITSVGGYSERFHLFEDYELWIRVLKEGHFALNIEEPLLLMRTPADLYLRRGGFSYARDLLRFNNWMKKIGWITMSDYILSSIPHAIVSILPNFLRKSIYGYLHR